MVLIALLSTQAHAASAGQTGSASGCGSCHGAETSTVTLASSVATLLPGETASLTLTITDARALGGLDVSASGGTLVAGSDTQLLGSELTHVAPTASLTFSFGWTAPTTEGTYTVTGAGLAADGDGTELGDAWASTGLVLTVDDGCDDVDADTYTNCSGDCDDTDPAVNPAATEVCDAADIDEDCDGLADDASASGTTTWYVDLDGDGYGDDTNRVSACDVTPGLSAVGGDCDDTDAAFNPGAAEPDCTDPNDYNCDGATGYDDWDGDGWTACQDCNDGAAAVSPGATETCDGVDDDCDGNVDESDATDARTWYRDEDDDGYGDPSSTRTACDEPHGYTSTAGDCDDDDPDANPDAPETWYDGVDQDCDGHDDDRDGDGFGIATDCDDLDAAVFPGAPGDAWYDGADTDCGGNSDFDADGDGFDSSTFGGADCDDADASVWPGAPDDPYDGRVTDCDEADEFDQDGDGYATTSGGGDDCDDANSSIHPNAEEVWYDGIDQDCDGTDTDRDGDGVPFDTDCDDTDPEVGNCYVDTGEGDTASSPEVAPPEPEIARCGCASRGGGVSAGLILALALVRRRT